MVSQELGVVSWWKPYSFIALVHSLYTHKVSKHVYNNSYVYNIAYVYNILQYSIPPFAQKKILGTTILWNCQ